MSVMRLVYREIAYRKLDFALAAIAVWVAVGCLVAQFTLLRAHENRLAEMKTEKTKQTAAMMALAEDDYRKIMKEMGYNLLIFSREQDLGEFYTKGYATKPMSESLVDRLVNSDIYTIQHIMPELYQPIPWPERNQYPIILIGVRGEVHHKRSNNKEPMIEPVERGTLRIGSAIQAALNINAGDTVTLLGRVFTIAQVHPEQGNTDDASVWMHLEEAQELLQRPNEVNAILALSCFCAGGELERVRKEIAGILPETQVVQRIPEAIVRAKARGRVETLTRTATESETAYHERLAREREAFSAWLMPLIVIGATLWIGLLAWGNVRTRRTEIGALRAIGFRTRHIAALFLSRAFLIGAGGAAAGYVSGLAAGAAWGNAEGVPLTIASTVNLFNPALAMGVLILAPVQACLATWIPALWATRQDPAAILREE